jgi:hypothetical protein
VLPLSKQLIPGRLSPVRNGVYTPADIYGNQIASTFQ